MWTKELTSSVVAQYNKGATVQAIAETTGKSVASVRAKLVAENVYKKPPKKSSSVTAQKGEIVKALGITLTGNAEAFSSLTLARKDHLELLWGVLVALSDSKEA